MRNGFVQEQAIQHRVIDETNEDIIFLAYAVTNDTITDRHQKFLDAFREEEIDESGNMLDSKQKRPMIPRTKIRSYIASIEGGILDRSRGIEVYRTISKAYSGFVQWRVAPYYGYVRGKPSSFLYKRNAWISTNAGVDG